MSDKPFPALCRDCKWSQPENRSDWNNVCTNPSVVAVHPWALANNREGLPAWPQCHDERNKRSWFAPCGIRGKLWEPK
jgi:hypothetical protein